MKTTEELKNLLYKNETVADAAPEAIAAAQDFCEGYKTFLDNAKTGTYLIDMTTTSPALWQRIAAEAKQRGLRPLDAPVSGGDSGARNARVVKPGMAVTMDFRQDRVTVQVDAQNRIERASCG